MKPKQILAISLLCIVGLLIAYSLSLLTPPESLVQERGGFEELDAATYAQVEKEFSLPAGNAVYVNQHEGDYYLLGVYPNATEGGGFWAIVYKTADRLQVVDAGNKYEYEVLCAVLEEHDVPYSVAPQCDNGELFINRSDGSMLEHQTMSGDAE